MDDKFRIRRQRGKYLSFQTVILTILLLITTLTFLVSGGLSTDSEVRVLFAPFLSLVPLLFALSIMKSWTKQFQDHDFTRKEIIRYCSVVGISTVFSTLIIMPISWIATTEILIAVMFTMISLLVFVYSRLKDMLGMSVITGMAEGLIIYMVFFFQ